MKYSWLTLGMLITIVSGLSLSLWIPAIRTPILASVTQITALLQYASGSEIQDTSPHLEVTEENIKLRAEIASLLYLKQENDLLKSAIETKNQTSLTPLKADIVSFDSDFLRDTMLVNVGSNQGVQMNQPVMYLGHLIGQVIEVYPNRSRVQTIFDAESTIGVNIGNESQSEGLLKSSYGTALLVDLVPKVESITEGQPIYTSGVGGIPDGLFIGSIKNINEGDLFHRIEVDYPINIRRIHTVFILTS